MSLSPPNSSFMKHNHTASQVPPSPNNSLSDLLANAALVSNFLDQRAPGHHYCSSAIDSFVLPPEARIDSRINQLNQDIEKELYQFRHSRQISGWSNRIRNSIIPGSWSQIRSSDLSPEDGKPAQNKNKIKPGCLIISTLILVILFTVIILAVVFAVNNYT